MIRRRFRAFRRAGARKRWDMQEYRECERLLAVDTANAFNCTTPLTFADLLATPDAEIAGSVTQAAGAQKGIIWGGCRGQFQYTVGVTLNTDDTPATDAVCNLGIFLTTAIVRLPLDPAAPGAPLYIPNLIATHSQLATTYANKSDNVESVLWRRQERLRWAAFTLQDDFADSCWPLTLTASAHSGGGQAWIAAVATSVGMFGRTWGRGEFRAKVKRALDERQAIFLVRNISIGSPLGIDGGPTINVLSDCWIQFALRTR